MATTRASDLHGLPPEPPAKGLRRGLLQLPEQVGKGGGLKKTLGFWVLAHNFREFFILGVCGEQRFPETLMDLGTLSSRWGFEDMPEVCGQATFDPPEA